MTAGKLRLLRVLLLEDVANAVEELDVTLLGVSLQGGDKGMRHGSGCLGGDCGIRSTMIAIVSCALTKIDEGKSKGKERRARGGGLTMSDHPCFQTT